MKTQIRKFLQEEDGVTALEYGILAAIVAVALAAIFLPKLQDLYRSLFGTVSDTVTEAAKKPTN